MYVTAQGLFIGFIIISELFLVLVLILYCGGFKRRGKKKKTNNKTHPQSCQMHFLKSPSFKLLLLTVWENNQIQIIYSLMYHQNTCNAHMLLWSSRKKKNPILKILTDFYCAVFSLNLLKFFPNLTVWMLILSSAAWLRVPCAQNSWQKCSEMCL